MRCFERKCNRVASGGTPWDPIMLLAKVPIGVTRYWKCILAQIWNWLAASHSTQKFGR